MDTSKEIQVSTSNVHLGLDITNGMGNFTLILLIYLDSDAKISLLTYLVVQLKY